jgi:septum site-determining protein MinD
MSRSIAIISGKGGSGKTMVTAMIACILDHACSVLPEKNSQSILAMDADTGTAGLTYYLGLKYLENFSVG